VLKLLRIVILNAVGNVMIQYVLHNAILSVNVLSVKYIVKRLLVLLVRSTVISPNVMYVVPRICARNKIAPSVKQYVLLLNVVLLVLLLMLYVLLCVKILSVNGSARSPPYVLVLSVN
jgi:hypothetical protein